MAKRTQTAQRNVSITKISNGTVNATIADTSSIPEPVLAYDWHNFDSSLLKVARAVGVLALGGNLAPSEAQVKAQYQLMGGKLTT